VVLFEGAVADLEQGVRIGTLGAGVQARECMESIPNDKDGKYARLGGGRAWEMTPACGGELRGNPSILAVCTGRLPARRKYGCWTARKVSSKG
jgi:hypothetical protein